MDEEIHWCKEHDKEEFWTTDPFDLDIKGIETWMWLCEDCEHERTMDI